MGSLLRNAWLSVGSCSILFVEKHITSETLNSNSDLAHAVHDVEVQAHRYPTGERQFAITPRPCNAE